MNYELIKTGGGYIVKLGKGMYLNSYHEVAGEDSAKIFPSIEHAETSIEIWIRG
jgi:hypothetical protein